MSVTDITLAFKNPQMVDPHLSGFINGTLCILKSSSYFKICVLALCSSGNSVQKVWPGKEKPWQKRCCLGESSIWVTWTIFVCTGWWADILLNHMGVHSACGWDVQGRLTCWSQQILTALKVWKEWMKITDLAECSYYVCIQKIIWKWQKNLTIY